MITKEKLPNFVVAGAAKSGSTTLYHYLKAHPEVFLPERKESRFFASEKLHHTIGYNKTSVFTDEEFKAPYEAVSPSQKAIGDFGNLYQIFPSLSITNIKQHLGTDVRLVFILRNPVKRAYSAYQMARRNFYEEETFSRGLELEEQRLSAGQVPCDIIAYKKMGDYFPAITAFQKHFPVHIIILEELEKDPQAVMSELFDFLAIDPSFQIQTAATFNKGGTMPSSKVSVQKFQRFLKSLKPIFGKIPGLSAFSEWMVNRLASRVKKNNTKAAEPLSVGMENRLQLLFSEGVSQLSQLISKDLNTLWGIPKKDEDGHR
mgnify:CR=1 FL=1